MTTQIAYSREEKKSMSAKSIVWLLVLVVAALSVAVFAPASAPVLAQASPTTAAPTTAATAAPTAAATAAPTGVATAAPTAAATAAPTGVATAAPTAAATSATPAKVFRVAVIMPSAINDLAFSQSMYDALVAVQKEMGQDKFQFAYTDNMFNVPDAAAAMRDYASKGYDLVIAHGSQYGASLADIAPDFPKTAFAWGTAVDTFESKGVKNISAYTVLSDQGGYVEGVIAAKLSKSGTVGAIGPVPAGDGKLTIDGFGAGAKATSSNIKVLTQFTNDFSNAALMSQAAQTMISAGADVLTGTSQAVVGAIAVCKDKNVLWFGNQSSQTSLAPQIVVANQVYDWTPFLKTMIENTQKGILGGQVMTGTLQNKVLVIQYNPDYALPADVKALADKTIQGLIDGTIQTGVK
jgi:basic membrane protein A